jgi:hypothetical protein
MIRSPSPEKSSSGRHLRRTVIEPTRFEFVTNLKTARLDSFRHAAGYIDKIPASGQAAAHPSNNNSFATSQLATSSTMALTVVPRRIWQNRVPATKVFGRESY